MKRIILVVTTLAVVSGIILAANTSVATIDTQQILTNYSGSATIQKDLDSKKTQLQAVLKTEQDNLTSQQNALNQLGTKATPEQVQAFQAAQQQFQTDYQSMQQELNQYQQDQMQQLKTSITTASHTVLVSQGYPLILDSQAVLYGGTDVSNQVLTALNGMQSIDLND